MADTPKHSVSVAGIVVDDHGRVLVVQRRDNSRWEPPGGVLELDESPEEGVCREVQEETGLRVEPVRLSGVYKNMSHGIVALVFRCSLVGGAASISDESRAVEWHTMARIRAEMPEAYSVRISDAIENAVVPVRSHDGANLLGTAS